MSGQEDDRQGSAQPAATPAQAAPAEDDTEAIALPETTGKERGLPPIVWVPGLIAATLLLLAVFGLN